MARRATKAASRKPSRNEPLLARFSHGGKTYSLALHLPARGAGAGRVKGSLEGTWDPVREVFHCANGDLELVEKARCALFRAVLDRSERLGQLRLNLG